jgi:hypothetical protein
MINGRVRLNRRTRISLSLMLLRITLTGRTYRFMSTGGVAGAKNIFSECHPQTGDGNEKKHQGAYMS